MDAADMADKANEPFEKIAQSLLLGSITPEPAIHTNAAGAALCVRCDADITKRRRIIVNAQRCADCQHDVESEAR